MNGLAALVIVASPPCSGEIAGIQTGSGFIAYGVARGRKRPSNKRWRGRLWLNDGSCIRLRAQDRYRVWRYEVIMDPTHDAKAFPMRCVIDACRRKRLTIRIERRLNALVILDVLERPSTHMKHASPKPNVKNFALLNARITSVEHVIPSGNVRVRHQVFYKATKSLEVRAAWR